MEGNLLERNFFVQKEGGLGCPANLMHFGSSRRRGSSCVDGTTQSNSLHKTTPTTAWNHAHESRPTAL
jgi:hypothetical protein